MNTVEGDEHRDKMLMGELDSKSLTEMVIISRKNPVYIAQRFIYVLCCLVSSYTYVWFAAFAPPKPESTAFYIMLTFELQFFLSILVTFFVEFEVEGQVQPVRDLQKIAANYAKGFLFWDLLPVLPLQLVEAGGGGRYFYLIKIIRLYIGLDFLDASAIV